MVKLTIEAARVTLDEDDVRQHASVRPGRYLMLAISDTGTGMDIDLIGEHIELVLILDPASGSVKALNCRS